jgi:hypothetical protein
MLKVVTKLPTFKVCESEFNQDKIQVTMIRIYDL